MKLRSLLILLLITLDASSSLAAGEKHRPITASDFLAEYRPALSKLESRYQNFTCQAIHRRQSYTAIVDYVAAHASFLSVQTYDSKAEHRPPEYPRVHLRSESPNCFFELSTDVPGKKFFISQIGDNNTEPLKRYHSRYNKPIALAAVHIFDVPMRTLIDSNDVVIEKVVRLADPKMDVVSVEFQLNAEVYKFHKVIVKLQPSQNYQIVSYELFFSADSSSDVPVVIYSGQVRYQLAEQSQFEVPIHVLIQCDDGRGRVSLVEDVDIDQFRFDIVSQAQFQLPNFGIADISTSRFDASVGPQAAAAEIKTELTLGNEVDLLIPVPTEQADYRIIGVESVQMCGRLGCGQVKNLPQQVLAETPTNVTYQFKSQNLGEEVIEVVLITDHPARPRIPISMNVVVKSRIKD